MKKLLLLLGWLVALPAGAAVNVFACEPEWAALARELGGDKVTAFAATTALQDAHRVEARPALIARMRSADLVVCSGADLEVGWLPLLLSQSGNPRVQPGGPGFLEASRLVTRIEVPRVVDRALGDLHPAGNPHVHLDPRNIAKVADALATRLGELDAPNAAAFTSRKDDFLKRWQAATQRWERDGASLKGAPVVVHHKEYSYLIRWLGMREVASLEPKPGIPPTPAHLASLVEQMKREPAKLIIYSAYNGPQAAQFLAERTAIPAVELPYSVGGSARAKDLFGLFDDTLERLLKGGK